MCGVYSTVVARHVVNKNSLTVHRHLYGFLLGQKTDHTNGGDHTNDGGDHTNDGSLEFRILTYFSRQIFLNGGTLGDPKIRRPKN